MATAMSAKHRPNHVSSEDAYTKSAAYQNLIKLGPAILPQLAAKLTTDGNDQAVIPCKDISPSRSLFFPIYIDI